MPVSPSSDICAQRENYTIEEIGKKSLIEIGVFVFEVAKNYI